MSHTWFDANSDPYEISAQPYFARPFVVLVDLGTGGSVELQFQDRAGTWFTPDGYNLDKAGPHSPEAGNLPPSRIIATGNASFQVYR